MQKFSSILGQILHLFGGGSSLKHYIAQAEQGTKKFLESDNWDSGFLDS